MISTPRPLSLKLLVFIQFLVGAGLTLGVGFRLGWALGSSFAVGAALMIFSVLFYAFTWRCLIEKKSIAWTSLLIVFKYAVLLESIFLLMRTDWFSPISVGLGIASFTLAALVFALVVQQSDREIDQRKR